MKIICNEIMQKLDDVGHVLSNVEEAFRPDNGDIPEGYIPIQSKKIVNKMDEGLRTSGLGGVDGLKVWIDNKNYISVGIEAKVNNIVSKITTTPPRTKEDEEDKYFILRYCIGFLTKYMEMDNKIDGTNERIKRANLSIELNIKYSLFIDAFHKKEYLRNAPKILRNLELRDNLVRQYFKDVKEGKYKAFTTKKGKNQIEIVCNKIDEFNTVFLRKDVLFILED